MLITVSIIFVVLCRDRLSMTNLSIAITSLGTIARKRPQHTQTVMTTLLALNSVPNN